MEVQSMLDQLGGRLAHSSSSISPARGLNVMFRFCMRKLLFNTSVRCSITSWVSILEDENAGVSGLFKIKAMPL